MPGEYQRLLTKSGPYRKIEQLLTSRERLEDIRSALDGGLEAESFESSARDAFDSDDSEMSGYISHVVEDFINQQFQNAWEAERPELRVKEIFEATLDKLTELALGTPGSTDPPKALSLWNSYRADIDYLYAELIDSERVVTMVVYIPVGWLERKFRPDEAPPETPLPAPPPSDAPDDALINDTIRPEEVVGIDDDAADNIYRITAWNVGL